MNIEHIEVEYIVRLTHHDLLLINKAVAIAAGIDVRIREEEKDELRELNNRFLDQRGMVLDGQLKSVTDAMEKSK